MNRLLQSLKKLLYVRHKEARPSTNQVGLTMAVDKLPAPKRDHRVNLKSASRVVMTSHTPVNSQQPIVNATNASKKGTLQNRDSVAKTKLI